MVLAQAHSFLQTINQDPILSQIKLIAEPWDIGPGGYQLGAFPAPWREWNDKYRDVVRRFWQGQNNMLAELANVCMAHSIYSSITTAGHLIALTLLPAMTVLH